MPIEPRPLRRRLLVRARPLVLAVFAVTLAPSPIPAQDVPIAIKSFWFRYSGQVFQSGASMEASPGEGTLELHLFSTTGQPSPKGEWRIKAADGSFDSGLNTFTAVPPGLGAVFNQPWPMRDGTHQFIASVVPSPGSGAATSAQLTVTVRLVYTADLRFTMIPVPPASLVTTQLVNPLGNCTSDPPSLAGNTVKLVIRNPAPPPGFKGCTLVADLFKGILIGNGWAVHGAHHYSTSPSAATVWEVEPSGARLYGRLRMPVTSSQPYGYFTSVRIGLKGPAGTQPTFALERLRLR